MPKWANTVENENSLWVPNFLKEGGRQEKKKKPTKLINCKHVPFPMEKEGQLRRQSQDPGRRMKSQEEEQLMEQLYCGLGVWVPPKSLSGSPNPQ